MIETYPIEGNPQGVDDNQVPWVDHGTTVLIYQLRPTNWHQLEHWCAGLAVVRNDAQAVELPGGDVVELGDYAVLWPDGRYTAEAASGFYQRFAYRHR